MPEQFVAEFLTVALVHAVAVASPGPDFAVVLSNSIRYGRGTAIFTSIGIGSGIFWHVLLSLVGIGLLLYSSPMAITALTWVAALYLIYLGAMGLRSRPGDESAGKVDVERQRLSNGKAFLIGFLTNGLNPKATLFFLSLYAVVVKPETDMLVRFGYGIYMAFATAAWFVTLSCLLGSQKVRAFMLKQGFWFDRITGLLLIGLALRLLMSG